MICPHGAESYLYCPPCVAVLVAVTVWNQKGSRNKFRKRGVYHIPTEHESWEDIRENILNYNEEGGGEQDQVKERKTLNRVKSFKPEHFIDKQLQTHKCDAHRSKLWLLQENICSESRFESERGNLELKEGHSHKNLKSKKKFLSFQSTIL